MADTSTKNAGATIEEREKELAERERMLQASLQAMSEQREEMAKQSERLASIEAIIGDGKAPVLMMPEAEGKGLPEDYDPYGGDPVFLKRREVEYRSRKCPKFRVGRVPHEIREMKGGAVHTRSKQPVPFAFIDFKLVLSKLEDIIELDSMIANDSRGILRNEIYKMTDGHRRALEGARQVSTKIERKGFIQNTKVTNGYELLALALSTPGFPEGKMLDLDSTEDRVRFAMDYFRDIHAMQFPMMNQLEVAGEAA